MISLNVRELIAIEHGLIERINKIHEIIRKSGSPLAEKIYSEELKCLEKIVEKLNSEEETK